MNCFCLWYFNKFCIKNVVFFVIFLSFLLLCSIIFLDTQFFQWALNTKKERFFLSCHRTIQRHYLQMYHYQHDNVWFECCGRENISQRHAWIIPYCLMWLVVEIIYILSCCGDQWRLLPHGTCIVWACPSSAQLNLVR